METKDQKIPLSIVIVAKNEEDKLASCLERCVFAKEIVLVDDESTDKTVEIAKQFGAKVYSRKMEGWGRQQTFAISKATQPWIFLLDCDEWITPELEENIKKAVLSNENFSYEVQRQNRFKHYKIGHGPLRPDWVIRLMKKEGASVEGVVHQKIIYPSPLKKLKGYLIHFTYDNPEQYYNKMNKYARLSAEKYMEEGKDISFFRDIVFRPAWAAFKVYFINRGFLDGKMGFIFAANHYGYTLQKYVRLFLLKNSNGKF